MSEASAYGLDREPAGWTVPWRLLAAAGGHALVCLAISFSTPGATMLNLDFGRLVARGRLAQKEASVIRARAARLCESLDRFRPARLAPSIAIPAHTIVVHTDGSGVLGAVDDAAATWLSVPVNRLLGMHLLHFVHRRDTRILRAMVMGLGYAGATVEAELRFRRRGGCACLMRAVVRRLGPNAFEWTLRAAPEVRVSADASAERPASSARTGRASVTND